MPESIHPETDNAQSAYPKRPSVEICAEALAKYAHRGPFVLYDWRTQWDGLDAANELAKLIKQPGKAVTMMKIDADYFAQLHIYVAPDVDRAFRAGQPIVVEMIPKDKREKGKRHRPQDTDAIKSAKQALETTAFRLLASQTVVERHQNPDKHAVVGASAENAASSTLAGIKSHHGQALVDKKLSTFDGLIDRGRRKVRDFFGARNARDVTQAFAFETQKKLDSGASSEAIAEHNVAQMQAFAEHKARAVARETAMYRWTTAGDDQPVEEADGRDLTNTHLARQSAHDLMQVAIAGGLNPSDVQSHLLTMRQPFDTGRKIGLLLRGQTITVTLEDASEIEKAIATVRRGPPETHEDGCYYYLADALAQCEETLGLSKVAARVRNSKMQEIVTPARNLS